MATKNKKSQETTQKKGKKHKKERKVKIKTIADELLTFERTINLSLEDEVLKKYAGQCGYPPKRLLEGKKLREKAEKAHYKQLTKRAEQITATRIYYELKEKAHATYLHFIRTCRLAFVNDPAMQFKLELKGKRKHDHGGWAVQTQYFYDTILTLPDAMARLAKYNTPRKDLEAGNRQLKAAVDAEVRKLNAIAESQRATDWRNRALKELREWMNDYLRMMQVALKPEPQLKEKLGFIVPMTLK